MSLYSADSAAAVDPAPDPLLARHVLQMLPDMVLVLNSSGEVVYVNRRYEEVFGYRVEELVGRDWFDLGVPEADRRDMRQLFTPMTADRDAMSGVNAVLTRDGGCRHVAWSSRTLFDEKGRTFAVLALGRDVTDAKQTQRRAVEPQRLAAIGRAAAILAHESRNALQRSQACLEMLALEVQDRPRALDLVYRIQIAQDQLARLYEEVRRYAAPVVLRRSPENLADVVAVAWSQLEPLWKSRAATLRYAAWDDRWRCNVDQLALVQVFRNVLDNALAAAADPVLIDIAWSDALLEGKSAVRVSVGDNGPGMNAEDLEKVFQPFFTTKARGTGLGLAISRRIVEAHGGQISVQSGRGLEIVVVLPKEP